jgi:nucleotide-binding universal stress UspA family protein
MYKTIVVHLGSTPAMSSALGTAIALANSMDAHLIGTASTGVAELNYLMAAGAPMAMVPAANLDQMRAEAEQRLAGFQDHCREQGVASFEGRLFDTSPADALLLQSRYCDLLVAGQEELLDDGLLNPAQLPGTLVAQAARPLLVVPRAAPPHAAFGKIMVAWNGSPGISRVLAFAMPLISRAEKIVVAVCNPGLERIDAGGEPGADLATYLARHHRNVEVVVRDTNEDTETALAGLAEKIGADLMLAGAFGHTRLHEWVLGSTTRGLMERTRIPLLMAH